MSDSTVLNTGPRSSREALEKALAAVLIATLGLVPHVCWPEPATDSKMAAEAMMPYVPRDPEQRDELLKSEFSNIVELANRSPDEIRPATVFFNRGLTVRELHDLHIDLGVQVVDVVMKAPEGEDGAVMSILGGMQDMFAIEGTLEERLSFLIAAQQKCLARMSQYMLPVESKAFSGLATRPFHVYSARIFGPNRSLKELQDHPSVAGVLLNLRSGIVSEFEAAKAYDGPHRFHMPGFEC